MLKQFNRHAKKATQKAKQKVKKHRFSRKNLHKVKSALKTQLKQSSSLAKTNWTPTTTGSDESLDTRSTTQPWCRFMESPFGALFIPPLVPKIPKIIYIPQYADRQFWDNTEFKTCNSG